MKRIGLLSDTHSYLHPHIFSHFEECDELWHAGDVGDIKLLDKLREFKPLRGVYGNIDGHEVRKEFQEDLIFRCEGLKVYMTHIGGYPPKYNTRSRGIIKREQPDLFISGHSHILKIMHDPSNKKILHINPGAAGKIGFQQVSTVVRFSVDQKRITDMQVIELAKNKNPA
jgi:putative phosphoesterase